MLVKTVLWKVAPSYIMMMVAENVIEHLTECDLTPRVFALDFEYHDCCCHGGIWEGPVKPVGLTPSLGVL